VQVQPELASRIIIELAPEVRRAISGANFDGEVMRVDEGHGRAVGGIRGMDVHHLRQQFVEATCLFGQTVAV